MDGRTDDGEMGGFKCVHVCACVCARPCLCACDPVCEDGVIPDQMDRWPGTDGLIDGLLNGCIDGLIDPRIWVLITVVRHIKR